MSVESSHPKSPRWARRKEARPGEILAVALDLFVERGYAATRLEEVAQRAGVSKGTLYLYFAGKEELFKAVVRENLVSVLNDAEGLFEDYTDDSIALLRRIIFGWWRRIGSTKLSGISKLVMSESGNFPELAKFYQEEFIMRGQVVITQALEQGVARGDFRAIDAEMVTKVILAPIIMLLMWKHAIGAAYQNKPVSPEEYLNCFIDLCLNGILKDKTPSGQRSFFILAWQARKNPRYVLQPVREFPDRHNIGQIPAKAFKMSAGL